MRPMLRGIVAAARQMGGAVPPVDGEYRYWRVYCTATNGADYLAMQEIELRATLGGADLTTTGMTAAASEFYGSGGNTAAKAIDNDFDNYTTASWVSNGSPMPQWWSVDLGAPAEVQEVAIWPQAYSGGPDRAPRDFKIQGSNNGSTWFDVKTLTGITGWSAGASKVFSLEP